VAEIGRIADRHGIFLAPLFNNKGPLELPAGLSASTIGVVPCDSISVPSRARKQAFQKYVHA
jgi:hypothetical protein